MREVRWKLGERLWVVAVLTCVAIAGSVSVTANAAGAKIHGPSPSPDGKLVAFAVTGDQPRVGIFNLENDDLAYVDVPGRVEGWSGMSWHPDGEYLVATVIEDETNDFEIWKLSWPEQQLSRLVAKQNQICQRPLVSPDGKHIVFRTTIASDELVEGLGVYDLDSGTSSFLEESVSTFRLGFDWAPNGRTIYAAPAAKTQADSGLYAFSVDDNAWTKERVADIYPGSLNVSNSGELLAFTLKKVADGKRMLGIASFPEFDYDPPIAQNGSMFTDWHPAENKLAFVDGDTIKVWHEKDSIKKIAEGQSPVWAQRGRSLVFVRNERELWRYSFDNEDLAKLYRLE